MKLHNKSDLYQHEGIYIPEQVIENWYNIANSLSKVSKTPVILFRYDPKKMKVISVSANEKKYKAGDCLSYNSAICAEEKFNRLSNIINLKEWNSWQTDSLNLNGSMYSVMTIYWPDRSAYGMLCIKNSKSPVSNNIYELMHVMKNAIEENLKRVWQAYELKDAERRNMHFESNMFQMNKDAIDALGETLAARDPYTSNHTNNVGIFSCIIANRLGKYSAEELRKLNLAASIHDIGKIYIPMEILNKPGRLSSIEFDLIKTHTNVGAKIVQKIETEIPILDIVRHHHERLDGSGYPDGLKGRQISMNARIVAVADTVDAMLELRPYRRERSIDDVIAVLQDYRGDKFDPDVVDITLEILKNENFCFDDLREEFKSII